MTWTYSGDPATSDRDEVRFLVGDTDPEDKMVEDAEINWAIANQSTTKLAAAVVLRALASKFSRMVTNKVGDLSTNCSDLATAFSDRANELDPSGLTKATALCLPSFGGLSISGKETLSEDTDAVQPRFYRGQDDIPGGYPDDSPPDDPDWIR